MTDSHPVRSRVSDWPLLAFTFGSLLLGSAHVSSAEDLTFGFTAGANEEGVADPWKILGNPSSGEPKFRVQEDDAHGKVLELHAKGDESDGIYRPVGIKLDETPQIHFAWKVRIHPDGEIGTAKGDAAVQVHLDFGRRGLRRQVLTYVYDPKARPGRVYDDSTIVAVNRAIVLNSGSENLDQWLSHSRNVINDFRACYGTVPPPLQNISVFCDANDSNTEALGYCTAFSFTKAEKKD